MTQPEAAERARAILARSRGLQFCVPGPGGLCDYPFDPAVLDDPHAIRPPDQEWLKAQLEQAIEDLLAGELVTSCHQVTVIPPAGTGVTADADAVSRYLRHLELLGQRAGTIYARKRALARLRRALPVPLLDARPGHLAAWRETLDMGPDGIVHEVCHAQQFYDFCVKAGLAGDNPAAGLPVPKVPRRLPRPISEDDLLYALDAAPRRVRIWLVLAAWAGMRACEIASLRRENILDTATPPVIVIAADATKGSTERIIPLSRFVLAELRAAGLPARGWVFRRADGRRGPNRPWLISRLANDHLHACGIPETLHQLRHRFGTQAYRVRRDLRAVQAMMGHASPNTTAGYAAYDNAEAAADVEALPVPPPRPG